MAAAVAAKDHQTADKEMLGGSVRSSGTFALEKQALEAAAVEAAADQTLESALLHEQTYELWELQIKVAS